MNEPSSNPYEPPRSDVVTAAPAENTLWQGEKLRVKYDRTVEDMVQVNMRLYAQRSRRQRAARWIRLALIWIAVGIVLWSSLGTVEVIGLYAGMLAILSLLWIPAIKKARLRRAYRNLFMSGKVKKRISGPIEICISPRGLEESTESSQGLRHWKAIDRIEATEDGVFFDIDALSSIYVPARALGGEESVEEFAAQARKIQTAATDGESLLTAASDWGEGATG